MKMMVNKLNLEIIIDKKYIILACIIVLIVFVYGFGYGIGSSIGKDLTERAEILQQEQNLFKLIEKNSP